MALSVLFALALQCRTLATRTHLTKGKFNMKKEKIPVFLCLAGLWIRIRMDLHPFYLLDPDPGGKNSNKKGRKIHRNWYWYRYPVVIVIYKKKI